MALLFGGSFFFLTQYEYEDEYGDEYEDEYEYDMNTTTINYLWIRVIPSTLRLVLGSRRAAHWTGCALS